MGLQMFQEFLLYFGKGGRTTCAARKGELSNCIEEGRRYVLRTQPKPENWIASANKTHRVIISFADICIKGEKAYKSDLYSGLRFGRYWNVLGEKLSNLWNSQEPMSNLKQFRQNASDRLLFFSTRRKPLPKLAEQPAE